MRKNHYWVTAVLSAIGLAVTAGSLQLSHAPMSAPEQASAETLMTTSSDTGYVWVDEPGNNTPTTDTTVVDTTVTDNPIIDEPASDTTTVDTTVQAARTYWDFKFSSETIEKLRNDDLWAEWDINVFWFGLDTEIETDKPFVYSSNEYITELKGLTFGAIRDTWIEIFIDCNASRIGLFGENTFLGVTDLKKGNTVTLRYANSEMDSTFIQCISGNAEVTAGKTATDSTIAEVTFTMKEPGTLKLYTYSWNMTYIYSIKVGSLADVYLLKMNEATALVDSLSGYPAVQAELQSAIKDATLGENATDEQYDAALTSLDDILSQMQKFLDMIGQFNTNIAQAEAILANEPSEDLSQALAQAKALDTNTASSSDYFSAYDALRTELALYNYVLVDRENWNFTTIIIVDELRYRIDPTNYIAEFAGLKYSNTLEELNIPAIIEYNGNSYHVVAICNEYSNNQNYLKKVSLPKTMRYIGSYAFYYYTALKDITLHSKTPIECEDNAFDKYKNHVFVHVPDGSFHDYRLSSPWGNFIIIPETPVDVKVNVEEAGTLGRLVLEEAGYLQEVNKLTVSGALNEEDWQTLKAMANLISIDMSKVTNTTIPSSTFKGSRGLVNVELPLKLKTIEYSAFDGCKNLTSIEFPNSLTSLQGGAFEGCSNLQTIKCNEGLTSIGSNCFYNCTSLKEVNLNEGLQSIGTDVFAYANGLTTITLPASLRSCERPFTYCNNLKTIISKAMTPPYTKGYCPISGADMTVVKLLVPSWSVVEYQLAAGWNQFYTIEASDYVPQDVVIYKDFVFALKDTLAADYRPNIDLRWSSDSYTDAYGYSNYYTGNLTISSRSKLPINHLSMYFSPYAKYYLDETQYNRIVEFSDSYSMTSENPTCLMVNGEMRAEDITIHLINLPNCWQFISFPFDVRMSDIVPEDSLTQWVVREYSGENRANGLLDSTWVNLTANDVLQANKGYIMHCYNANASNIWYGNSSVTFTVTPMKESVNRQAIFISDDRTVALEEHLSEFDHNRSWNLIGNPYPTFFDTRYLDFTAPLTIWNSSQNNYMAVSPVDDDFILSPGESFFVQRPVDQSSITFAKEGRQTHNHVRTLQNGNVNESDSVLRMPSLYASATTERQVINLVLSDGQRSDRTRVVINENATAGYDLNCDANKFAAVDASVPQLFTVGGAVRYAINERPIDNGIVEMGMHVGGEGMYSLTLKSNVNGSVVVEDRENGTFTEITADKGYTFSAEKAGDLLGRFFLHLNMQQGEATGLQGVDALEGEDNAPAYNLNGQQIDTKTYKGVVVKKGLKRVK